MSKQAQESKTNLILKQIAAGISGLSSPTVSVSSYQSADIDIKTTFADSFLIGKLETTGLEIWYIKRIKQVGANYEFTYALEENNPSMTSYALGWTNRLTLTYGQLDDITIP